LRPCKPKSGSRRFSKGWVTLGGRERRPPTTVGVRKLEWYQNIRSALFGFVTKHGCDRPTDRQNYDSQDRASIAASRGIKPFRSVPAAFQPKPRRKLQRQEMATRQNQSINRSISQSINLLHFTLIAVDRCYETRL